MATKLDSRFIKVASVSGLESDSTHALKIKTGQGVTCNSSGLALDKSLINELYIENHTITASDVTSKTFTVSQPFADTNQLSLIVMGGPYQRYGTDFTAADSTSVGWNGLGLQGTIIEGDKVQVSYPV